VAKTTTSDFLIFSKIETKSSSIIAADFSIANSPTAQLALAAAFDVQFGQDYGFGGPAGFLKSPANGFSSPGSSSLGIIAPQNNQGFQS
jgi:hypothetical protein